MPDWLWSRRLHAHHVKRISSVFGCFGVVPVLPVHQGGEAPLGRMLAEHERRRRHPFATITPSG